MFRRTEDGVTKNGSNQSQGRLNSILGDSSQMTGAMQIQGSVRIDGEFDGELVASETIVVGRTGLAKAELEAREVVVAGRVHGKLIGTERVELQEGAHVEGEITTPSFIIADGVFFNGSCSMNEKILEAADTSVTEGAGLGEMQPLESS